MDTATVALIVSIVGLPVTGGAVVMFVRSVSRDTIDTALKAVREDFSSEMRRERERTGEMFALKTEVAEMRAHVQQLVTNTGRLDQKLDTIEGLLRGDWRSQR